CTKCGGGIDTTPSVNRAGAQWVQCDAGRSYRPTPSHAARPSRPAAASRRHALTVLRDERRIRFIEVGRDEGHDGWAELRERGVDGMVENRKINPWTWQDGFGFSQAIETTGHKRVLRCSGQTSVNANGEPMHA